MTGMRDFPPPIAAINSTLSRTHSPAQRVTAINGHQTGQMTKRVFRLRTSERRPTSLGAFKSTQDSMGSAWLIPWDAGPKNHAECGTSYLYNQSLGYWRCITLGIPARQILFFDSGRPLCSPFP